MSVQSLSVAIIVVFASLSVPNSVLAQHALGTAFTYQGQLLSKGTPVDGTCDLLFSLYGEEEEGEAIAGPLKKSLVNVENGLFTTVLDFGDAPYDGSARWLDISVRCPGGSGVYTNLAPRQQLTAVPYALAGRVSNKRLTLGPLAFQPSTPEHADLRTGWWTPVETNSQTWWAEANLPHGATVRRVACWWVDEINDDPDDRNAGIMRLRLQRIRANEWPLQFNSGDDLAAAEFDTTGFTALTPQALADNTIDYAVVDAEQYVYRLSFSFSLHPLGEYEEFVHFGGCNIDYRTTAQ